MKKFIAGILAFAIMFTSADFSVLAAEIRSDEAHDAYAAWQDLLNGSVDDIKSQINAYQSMLTTYGDLRDEYQNTETEYSNFTYNGTGQTAWNVPTTVQKISVNSENRSEIQYFHQLGIQANAQFKAGNWLDDTTYDATAGMPTTENFFLTVGGTQYIIDVEYEFVSRPYVRRLWFSVPKTANYRYYKIGAPVQMNIQNDYTYDTTVTTDWENNAYTLLEKYKNTADDDKKKIDRLWTLTSLQHQMHLQPTTDGSSLVTFSNLQGGTGDVVASANGHSIAATLQSFNFDMDYIYKNTTLAYINQEDWYRVGYNENPNTTNMSPDILAAIDTKRKIKEMIYDFKTQFQGLDDNYRADESVWNVDEKDPQMTAAEWNEAKRDDKIYWDYTYYALVRYSSNGLHYGYDSIPPDPTSVGVYSTFRDHGYHYSDVNQGVSQSYKKSEDAGITGVISNRYTSNNPWDPIFVTYLLEWHGFGEPGLDVSEDLWKSSFFSPTYKPALGISNRCCVRNCSNLEEFKKNHIIHPKYLIEDAMPQIILAGTNASGPTLGYTLMSKPTTASTIIFRYISDNMFSLLDHMYDYFIGPTSVTTGATPSEIGAFSNGTYGRLYVNPTEGDFMFNGDSGFLDRLLTLFRDESGVIQIDNNAWDDYMCNGYLAALNDADGIYLPGMPSNGNFVRGCEGAPDDLTASAENWSDRSGDSDAKLIYTYDESNTTFNQMVCVYYTHIYNLFCNVAGLFYYDELVDLFAGFPGCDFKALYDAKEAYNDKVAANLYLLFGCTGTLTQWESRESEPQSYASIDFNWTIPWACFPPGGDMDGNMEDIHTVAVQYGYTKSKDSEGDYEIKSEVLDPIKHYISWEITTIDANYSSLSNILQRSPQYCKWSEWAFGIEVDTTNQYRNPDTYVQKDFYLPQADAYGNHVWSRYYHTVHGNATNHWSPPAGSSIAICDATLSLSYHTDCSWHPSDCCEGVPSGGGWGHHEHHDGDPGNWGEDGIEGTGDEGETPPVEPWDDFVACGESDGSWHYHSPYPDGINGANITVDNTHNMRSYTETIKIHSYLKGIVCNYSAEDRAIDTTWTERTKDMSYSSCLEQKFNNVQYINILSWSIWALNAAKCYSLSSLLGTAVTLPDNNGTQDASGVITTAKNSVLNVIGYDLDEAGIDAERGNVVASTGYWNNLEFKGRVYNSYNTNSDGFTGINVNEDTHGIQTIPTLVTPLPASQRMTLMTWRASDSPYFKNEEGFLINDDPAAFKLIKLKYVDGSDDLHFLYYPYTQGGRSHSNFAGFVYQALAHSLSTSTGTDGKLIFRSTGMGTDAYSLGGISTSLPYGASTPYDVAFICHSYANSLRIQGDYLAVEIKPGVYFSIVGSFYDLARDTINNESKDDRRDMNNTPLTYGMDDTRRHVTRWLDHLNSSLFGGTDNYYYYYYYDTMKYSLAQEFPMLDLKIFKAYTSVTPWIPGKLAYILGRTNMWQIVVGEQGMDRLEGVNEFGTTRQNTYSRILCDTTDCWVIHTYNYSINDAQYTFWDLPTNVTDVLYSITGINWTSLSADRVTTLQGSINPYTEPDYNNPLINEISGWAELYGSGAHYATLGDLTYDHREYAIPYLDDSSLWKPYYTAYNSGMGLDHRNVTNANLYQARTAFVRDHSGYITTNISQDILPQNNTYDAKDKLSYEITVNYMRDPISIVRFHNGHGLDEGVEFQHLGNLDDTTSNAAPTWQDRNMGVLKTTDSEIPVIGYQSEGIGVQSITRDGATANTQRGQSTYVLPRFDPTWTMVSAGYSEFEGWLGPKAGGFAQFGANLNAPVYTSARIDPGEATLSDTGNPTPDTLTEAKEFGRNYPWLANLNLNRYLPNGAYYTGTVQAVYEKVAENHDSYPDVISTVTRDDEILVNAKYHQSTSSTYGTAPNRNDVPNSLVVYNPVTTESAHIIANSTYLPDSTNMGTDGYLSAFLQLELRDQRVAQRGVEGVITNQELIVDSKGNITSVQVVDSDSYHYELRTEDGIVKSLEESTEFTMENYLVTFDSSEVKTFGGSTGINYMNIEKSGKYKFSVQNRVGEWSSCTINLDAGDTVKFQDNFLLLEEGSTLFDLPYTSWQQAYQLYQEAYGYEVEDTTNFVPIKGGQTFKPMDASFYLKAGSMLKLQLYLDYEDTGIQPFHLDNFDTDNFQLLIDHETGSHTWTILIEALHNATLNALTFTADIDFKVERYEGSAVYAADVVLMHIGNSHDFVTGITSISSYYSRTSGSTSWISESGYYNSTVVDISGEWEIKGISMTLTEVVYGSMQNGSVGIELDNSNPHKVPNTNWRYYVLGWKTVDGELVTDISDNAIRVGSEIELIPPIGVPQVIPVTAKYLDQLANEGKLQVGCFNGQYYLTAMESSSVIQRRLEWYGIEIERWDMISFGEETTEVTTNTFLTVELTSQTTITQYSYEEVFKATGGTIYGAAYTVQFSANPIHKYSLISSNVNIDWMLVQDKKLDTVTEEHTAAASNYLSLDDEFLIYWDNLTDLIAAGSENNGGNEQRQISNVLGRGWDVAHDDILNVPNLTQSIKTLMGDTRAKYTSEWWNSSIVSGNNITDTTKWIYSKYVTFNVDMYGFTTGASFTLPVDLDPRHKYFNPTTPAFDPVSGNANNVVYIPAGTPVHLGYYSGDSTADNNGEFVDYGYDNGNTKSPNGFYTYHFWVPLEVGESINNVAIEYHVKSINDNDADAGQGTWKVEGVTKWTHTPTGQFAIWNGDLDEWGNKMVTPGFAYNKNNLHRLKTFNYYNDGQPTASQAQTLSTTEVLRPNNSVLVDVMSVAGRIGGLTVVDSGDPRWQDSFKIPGPDYAIAPLIKAVTRYSNGIPDFLTEGTQRRYAMDVADVRGRLWSISGTGYRAIASMSTYSRFYGAMFTLIQYWKDIADKYVLPVAEGFNIHDGSNLPVQQLGYELYLSLDTIGNYYGSSGQRKTEETTNNNDDYGQTKIQIRPIYYYFEVDEDGNVSDPIAVDIYFRRNGNYVLLNAGSAYASSTEATGSTDEGPYYTTAAINANYAVSLSTNNGELILNPTTGRLEYRWHNVSESKYYLDQTILRRLVTEEESKITYDVVRNIVTSHTNVAVKKGVTTTILEQNKLTTAEDDDFMLDNYYYYGNPQMLWLRERNRTFQGGFNTELFDTGMTKWTRNAQLYSQKWYFGLGLPANSIFVPHGTKQITAETIINGKKGYILVSLDVYAIGEKWVLHYQSDISGRTITIGGRPFDSTEWNVNPDKLPNLIPVSIYDTSKMGLSDLDTRGTY